MRNLVTGAAGFIGSHVAEKLIEDGEEVVGIDNFHGNYSRDIKKHNLDQVREKAGEDQFRFVEGSITDKEGLEKLPEDFKYVFHLAAVPGVRESVRNPAKYFKTNSHGTSNLLSYINSMDNFVLASSSSVYGEVPENELPVSEDRDLNPKAPYPLSKKQSEEIVRHYARLDGFDYSILRFFTVYGRRQRPDEAFTKFISMILDDDPVTIYGDGRQSRDFTHVNDVVDACMKAPEKQENGTYNISSGRRVTVNEMVDAIDNVMDKKVDREYVDQPDADVRHTHADIGKASEELDYRPGIDFEEGVCDCVSWVKQMKDKGLL